MNRTSIHEALQNQAARIPGAKEAFPLYADAFMDARQTSRHLARNFEQGMTSMIMRDKEDSQAICIRVRLLSHVLSTSLTFSQILGIHQLDKNTPLVSLIYEIGTSSDPHGINSTIAWVSQLTRATGGLPVIHSTIQEQALFRKLLAENERRVSSSFKPTKTKYETTFKASFVVPISPLNQIDIGKLTYNTGCIVCGSKTTSRCAQCQTVSYCGTGKPLTSPLISNNGHLLPLSA